ncbi:hypothetical protein AVEN_103073-1 [Araneus ventricosus]|uniref:Uncharacterized protein n=1 Tax=Araneus ventricosus TaxID=182803 RepID=A0A4Y2BAT2_ARAVE|nr:hypothetical protein AVEN_103073-1 [Araneus ventricosus]
MAHQRRTLGPDGFNVHQARLHGSSLVVSGFELGTLRNRSRHLTTWSPVHYITPPASPCLEPFGSFPVWMDGVFGCSKTGLGAKGPDPEHIELYVVAKYLLGVVFGFLALFYRFFSLAWVFLGGIFRCNKWSWRWGKSPLLTVCE